MDYLKCIKRRKAMMHNSVAMYNT